MSKEDFDVLQIVRDSYDTFNRGDVEAALSALAPSIEWWPAADEPETEPYRGHDGYRRLVATVHEVVRDLRVEVEELSAVGDRVVACVRFWGEGRASGVPVEVRETH